ncbi:MAG: hypothetical protein DELT_01615 [Desulfovibrio sp.]
MAEYSRYTPDITVTACGREWLLHRPANLEVLWDAMTEDEFGEDERLPYWVELWPASIALADWMREKQAAIRGKICIDMGCGLGLTAMAASSFGARVIAMDYEPEALVYARKNAASNTVPQPLWVAMDWRFPAVVPNAADFIWGGDIMYERRFVDPVLRFIRHALAPGGTVWMAEPNRDVYQYFRSALFHDGWSAKPVYTGKLPAIYIQPERVSVTLWEISRG